VICRGEWHYMTVNLIKKLNSECRTPEFFILLFDIKILKAADVRNKGWYVINRRAPLIHTNVKKIETLIISVFHSVPGVPRAKMERFAGWRCVKLIRCRMAGANAIRPYIIATRQILLLVSSATNIAPSGNTAIPTGRP